jgi:hypothetical protein
MLWCKKNRRCLDDKKEGEKEDGEETDSVDFASAHQTEVRE